MAPEAFESHQEEGTLSLYNEVVVEKSKVTVVGSGNWGSVAAKLIASNTLRLSSFHGIFYLPFPHSIYFLYLYACKFGVFKFVWFPGKLGLKDNNF